MENRRVLFKSLLAAGLASASPSRAQADLIRRQPLSGALEGLEGSFVEVVFEPGQKSAPHRHPGFVLGYVIEGRFRFAINGEPEKILGPGEVFYEPPDAMHLVSGNAGEQTARILAIIVAEKGAPLTTPV